MKWMVFISMLAFSALIHDISSADMPEPETMYYAGFTVTHSPGLDPAARQAAAIYPGMVSEIEKALGVSMSQSKVRIYILNNDDFRSFSGGSPVMALAIPSESSIILDYDSLRADMLVFRATLKHEIAHMTIHSEGGGAMPKWLDEGISQWASGGHSEIRQRGESWDLAKASLTGRLLPLEALKRSFPPDEEGMRLAYTESLSAVDMMVSDYGADIISKLLGDVHSGKSAGTSFYIHTGASIGEFAANWEDRTRKLAGIMSFVKTHFYEVLFLIAAVTLVIGFIRSIYRIRTYRDQEEEDKAIEHDGEE